MMDKPLKDWTVGELVEYCINHKCWNCCFGSTGEADTSECIFKYQPPCGWYDPRKPKFTEQEREDAKSLLKMFGEHISLANKGGGIGLEGAAYGMYIYLERGTFPSIKQGESYTLAEIAGCEN